MNTLAAFANGMANRGKTMMVFDWKKAAALIVERNPTIVRAGLRDDWGWTGGTIYEDGKRVGRDGSYTYLASTWATPEIEIDGEIMPCFVMNTPEENPGKWDSDTRWPEVA